MTKKLSLAKQVKQQNLTLAAVLKSANQQAQQQSRMLTDNQQILSDMVRIVVAIDRFTTAQNIAHKQMVSVIEGQSSVGNRASRIEHMVDRIEELHLMMAKVVSSLLKNMKAADIPPKYRKQIDAIARKAKVDGV